MSFCYGALNPTPIPYTIYQPDHWVFEGLWSAGGKPERFLQVGCIGYECDGCDVEWVRGMPIASHRDCTPENFEILGLAPGRMPDYEAVVHSKALFGLDQGFTPGARTCVRELRCWVSGHREAQSSLSDAQSGHDD